MNTCAAVTACRYVGRTSLRLQDRINQHVPSFIRNKQQPDKILPPRQCKKKISVTQQQCDSAIGLHLLQNKACAIHFNNQQFSILAKARTPFHLAALEATFIKLQKPILCRHKEFVYSLNISH